MANEPKSEGIIVDVNKQDSAQGDQAPLIKSAIVLKRRKKGGNKYC